MTPEARAREIAYRQRLFEDKFVRGSDDDCWIWIAAKNQKGNGIFGFAGVLANSKPAHVAAWLFYRDHSYDLDAPNIFHRLCGEESCVNPRHMAIVGPRGLINSAEVARFLASRHPAAASQLTHGAEIIERS